MPYPCLVAPFAVGLAVLLMGATPAHPAAPHAQGSSPSATWPAPSPRQPGDAFGEEVMLPARTIAYLQSYAGWDDAFATLLDAFKSVDEYVGKQGITPTGAAMTIYTRADDHGFDFRAVLPIAATPEIAPGGGVAIAAAPSGRALKFVHRSSDEPMDATYEAITNYLDERQLEAKDLFIEEYVTDPLKTAPDKLVVKVYVPVK